MIPYHPTQGLIKATRTMWAPRGMAGINAILSQRGVFTEKVH
jgi:hypothetical protein